MARPLDPSGTGSATPFPARAVQEDPGSSTVAFPRGSSEQRQRWLVTGYETGAPARATTLATDDLG